MLNFNIQYLLTNQQLGTLYCTVHAAPHNTHFILYFYLHILNF